MPHARLPADIIPRVSANLSRHSSVMARDRRSHAAQQKFSDEILCGDFLRIAVRRAPHKIMARGRTSGKRGLIPFRHVFGARHDRRHEQQQQNSADDVERQHEAISLIVS
jgi:hypothetical protein